MKNRAFIVLILIGVLMILVGGLLPAAKVVHAVLPAKGAAYADKLVAGMKCLKLAMILNGLLAVAFRPLKRWLWDCSATISPNSRTFFNRPDPGPIIGLEWVIFGGIVLLALSLRIVGATQSLFGDEIAVQQMFISRGLAVILTYFPHGTPQHVLYSILAFFSERLPLPVEFSYRLPALLFGTGAVALTCGLARRAFDRFSAAIIGLVSATALFGVVYSQNAKGYSATHFFVLLAIHALIRIASDWRVGRGWFWLAVACGGMVWMHLYNVYLCASLAVTFILITLWLTAGQWSLTLAWFRRGLVVFGGIGIILFLLYALQLPQIMELFAKVSDKPEEAASLNALRGWLMQLTFWGKSWPLAITCGVLAGGGLISLFRREPCLAIVLVFPVLFVWFMIVLKGAWIYPRYLVFSLPSFLILLLEAGRVLGRRRAWVGVLAVAGLFWVPNTRALCDYYAVGNQNIRGACRLVTELAQPNDPILAYGLARDLFPFYDRRIRPVSSLNELLKIRAETGNQIFLVYGWRKAWHGREQDFQQISLWAHPINQFPGFLMDSTERDGDVFVLASPKLNH